MNQWNAMNLADRNTRVAITTACNFFCSYCDGPKWVRKSNRPGAMEDYRSKPLNVGNISTETYLRIIKVLQEVGFWWVALTWGEPLLNKDWGKIVDGARGYWMSRAHLTTNGMLLEQNINKRGLPDWLTLLSLSLDTHNPEEFKEISWWKGDLLTVMKWLKSAKTLRRDLPIRANKVWLRSIAHKLPEYIRFCDESWVIDSVNLLSLIRKSDRDSELFQIEYISAQEIIDIVANELWCEFTLDSKYEFQARAKNGLYIVVKDTNLTMRTPECETCSMYCQEGFYTMRVATDGTLMACPDYTAKQSPIGIIDGEKSLEDWTLIERVRTMAWVLLSAHPQETIEYFKSKYSKRGFIPIKAQ